MVKLGPDGTFFEGRPMNKEDQGGLYAGFIVLKAQRLGVMDFGTSVTWLAMPRMEASKMANQIRTRVTEAFGKLPYNKSELPIRVVHNSDRDVIELHFSQPVGVLAANPELWLALAEVIEDLARTH